jgi:type IV secretory pathway VirB10-like protein
MSDQSDIAELERRITAALGRIGAGVDKWQVAAPDVAVELAKPADEGPDSGQASDEIIAALTAKNAALESALDAEKEKVAQLTEQLKSTKAREPAAPAPGPNDAKVEKLTQQLDVQGLELQRMRKSTVQLREHLRVLHEAAADNLADPQMINKAMLAELESLRATRHTETAEMDEILAELKPLIEEARANG